MARINNHRLAWIKVSKLTRTPEAQRMMSRSHVNKIAANFDVDCFTTILVCPVSDGKYAIMDGQTRTESAKKWIDSLKFADPNMEVPCQIIPRKLTISEQARIVTKTNARTRAFSRRNLFAVGVSDETNVSARETKKALERAGIKPVKGRMPARNETNCGHAFQRAYESGTLNEVIKIVCTFKTDGSIERAALEATFIAIAEHFVSEGGKCPRGGFGNISAGDICYRAKKACCGNGHARAPRGAEVMRAIVNGSFYK